MVRDSLIKETAPPDEVYWVEMGLVVVGSLALQQQEGQGTEPKQDSTLYQ